jgi:hypothetical protein
VDIIEAGFPIASPADSEAVRRSPRRPAPVIAALARDAPQDIEEAARALGPAERSRIHTFLATSDLHLARKLRITREECLDSAVSAVKLAPPFTDDVEFSAEDATRSDRDFPVPRRSRRSIDAGCTTVNLPDTVGYATPDELREFFEQIIAASPNAAARSSARTATTISASPSPTASPRSRAASARSSARSTASASAPATPRSKSGDGAARPARPPALTTPESVRRRCSKPASCCRR